MWICFNDSFLSIVYKGGAADEFCVRSRKKQHLLNVFPSANVIEGEGTDYRFRAFIKKDEVIKVVSERLASVDYDNFKSSVKDAELHDAYLNIWGTMFSIQRR